MQVPESKRLPVVAIINTTPDVVDMLRLAFETEGFVVVSTFTHAIRDGSADIEAFARQHQPDVIVYDTAPPYKEQLAVVPACQSAAGAQGTIVCPDQHQSRARPGLRGRRSACMGGSGNALRVDGPYRQGASDDWPPSVGLRVAVPRLLRGRDTIF